MTVWTLYILPWLAKKWPDLLATFLVLFVVLAWSVHERHVQAAKDAATITALRSQVTAAQSRAEASDRQSVQWSQSYAALKSTLDANDAALKAQEAAGQAALAKAKDEAARHAKALSDALAKQRAAYKGDSCAVKELPEGVE